MTANSDEKNFTKMVLKTRRFERQCTEIKFINKSVTDSKEKPAEWHRQCTKKITGDE